MLQVSYSWQKYMLWSVSEYQQRNSLLLELGYKSYSQYLRSDKWAEIRGLKLQRDPECFGCRKPARQVHHGKYTKENLLGDTARDLYSVCKRCHMKIEFTPEGYKRSPKDATDRLKWLHRVFFGRVQIKTDFRSKVFKKISKARQHETA